MIYLQLAFAFFKAGLFAIGGGLATLPYLMEMTKTHPEWFTLTELMNMVAISQSTPGPIGINMASYVGFHVGGLLGVVVTTFSIVLPSFIIILIVVRVLDRFRENRFINGGLEALRPTVTGLIAAAGFSVLWATIFQTVNGVAQFQWLAFVLFICMFTVLQFMPFKKLHPIIYIAAGAIIGIVLQL